MNCTEFKELMTAYVEDELPTHMRVPFEQHLESCGSCQAEMSTYENCTRIFRKFVTDEEPPNALRKAVFERCGCDDPAKCCPPPKQDS